jgi:hypothetical protein
MMRDEGGKRCSAGGGRFVKKGECISEPLVTPQKVDGFILRYTRKPRGGVVGDSLKPPMVKGGEKGFLHDVIGEIKRAGAQAAKERGAEARGFVAKKAVGEKADRLV